MNREIEYRGFDSTEWYYGDLEYNRKTDVARIHTYKEDGSYCRQYIVDPDTVGQFTGLLDKNGKKIFEGDVIKCGMRLYACEFIEGGFEFRDLSDSKLVLKAIVNHSCLIGNIHNNPELLNRKE